MCIYTILFAIGSQKMHSNILSCDCSDQVPYSHTHTGCYLQKCFFSLSQKYAFYFQHFSTWFPFISTPFTQMQTDTCEYSKIVKVQTSTLKHITKMCGWKNGEQILLHIYFHRRFKQIRIAAQKFAQFKSIIDV